MNNQKLSAVCGLGALTLIAGFGALPTSALPTALSVTRLASPVLGHDGNSGWGGWQDSQGQNRRDQDHQRRDRENRGRDRGNKRRDEENRRRDAENQRRRWEQNHDRNRHDYQGDQNRHRDDDRDNR